MHTTLTQRGYQWIINGYVQRARIVNLLLNALQLSIRTQILHKSVNNFEVYIFFIVPYDILYYYSMKAQKIMKKLKIY